MINDARFHLRLPSQMLASLPADTSSFVRAAIADRLGRGEWVDRPDFVAIVNRALPLAYERYRDPKNRQKGPLPTRVEECLDLLTGELIELSRALDGDGDIEYEAGDVLLCALAVANAVLEGGWDNI